MTDEEIKAARELVEKATPGPWEVDDAHADFHVSALSRSNGHVVSAVEFRSEQGRRDIAFVAAARTLVPQLLDRVEELRHEVAVADKTGRYLADVRDALVAERDEARTALAQAERERDELREHIRDIETAKPGTELATVQQQRDDFAAEIRRLDRVVVSWGDGYRALEAERDKLRALCREACDLALSYVASRSAHKPEAAAADRLAAIRDELEKP